MSGTEAELVPETWPDHADDLQSMIFGQSVLEFYRDTSVITTSGSDIDEINKIVASHPLNETKQAFTTQACERLWQALVPSSSPTLLVADVKLELLRQIKLYIQKGIEVLRSSPVVAPTRETEALDSENSKESKEAEPAEKPTSETAPEQDSGESVEAKPTEEPPKDVSPPPKRQKRARSRSTATEEAALRKRQKTGPTHEDPKPTQKESSTPETVTATSSAEPKQEDDADKETDKIKPTESTNAPEDSRKESETDTASQTDKGGADRETDQEVAKASQLEVPADSNTQDVRPSRRRRATRSARSTPEAESAAAQQESSDKTKARDSDDTKAKETRDADEEAKSDPSDSVEHERRETSVKAEATDNVSNDAGSGPKRKRSVTFDRGDPTPLLSFANRLSGNPKLLKYQDTDQHLHPEIISPTSLNAIASDVSEGKIDTLDEIEVELFKMLANSVMCGIDSPDSIKEAMIELDSALLRFRDELENGSKLHAAPPNSTPGSAKRRRKD